MKFFTLPFWILLIGFNVFAGSAVDQIECRDSIYESSETGDGKRIASWSFQLIRDENSEKYSLWYNFWQRGAFETEEPVADNLTCKFETEALLFKCDGGRGNTKGCVKSSRRKNNFGGWTYFVINDPDCSINSSPIPKRSFFQTQGSTGCFVNP